MGTNNDQIISLLKEAITSHNTVNFTYKGKNRTVNPHFYGLNGNTLQLHAYQIAGGSNKGQLPNWRDFRIESISEFINNKDVFEAPSPGYNPSGTHYTNILFQIQASKPPKP